MTLTAAALRHSYTVDWIDELEHAASTTLALPAAARSALVATIDAFAAEDGLLPTRAANVRAGLVATLIEQDSEHAPRRPIASPRPNIAGFYPAESVIISA
jgi:hypothetical protein